MNVLVRNVPLSVLTAVCLFGVQSSHGQTSVTTNPVGYVQLTCTASSDTVVAVPFTQPAAFVGTVASVSGSTVTVSGTASWTTNQFVYSGSGSSTYYAQMGPYSSGTDPLDGSYFTIASNGTNTLTLSLNGGSISSVPAGSTVTVYPYWTLGTVFPPSASGTAFIPTTSALFTQTVIYVPAYSGTGINLASPTAYFFYQGAWCLTTGSLGADYNDTVLPPDGYVTVRNPGSVTTVTTMGSVPMGNLMVPLATNATIPQDNFVSIARPVATTLNNLGLISSGAFTPTTNSLFTQDELLLFSGTQTGINNAPGSGGIYYYYIGSSGTGWRLTTDALTTDHGNDTIPAGVGFIIRKVGTGNGATAFWQNPPSY